MIQVPAALILGALGGVGKHILEIPFIHVAIENWLKTNQFSKWDEFLWFMLEKTAKIESPVEKEAKVVETVGIVQGAYDEAKRQVKGGVPEEEAFKNATLPWVEEVPPGSI